MEKRIIRKQVRLTSEEANIFTQKAKKANMSEAQFMRNLINTSVIKEKPDDRFYEVMKEMRKIGNNLNQIARRTNTYGYVDNSFYKQEADKWNEFMKKVKEKYLIN